MKVKFSLRFLVITQLLSALVLGCSIITYKYYKASISWERISKDGFAMSDLETINGLKGDMPVLDILVERALSSNDVVKRRWGAFVSAQDNCANNEIGKLLVERLQDDDAETLQLSITALTNNNRGLDYVARAIHKRLMGSNTDKINMLKIMTEEFQVVIKTDPNKEAGPEIETALKICLLSDSIDVQKATIMCIFSDAICNESLFPILQNMTLSSDNEVRKLSLAALSWRVHRQNAERWRVPYFWFADVAN